MSYKDKWVRRFSVDETSRHKNGFTIYKITSVLFPIESPEVVTVVSVWKRYSDVQQLHKSMQALHAGLHLRGSFPALPKYSYFKRFQVEVIEERSRSIKGLLEFIAEHKLLFTSTDFVNFLQTGYPEPENRAESVINAIRSSLHLPIEEVPPLEYQTSDDDSRSPMHSVRTRTPEVVGTAQVSHTDEVDFHISQIPIYEAADVEIRESPKQNPLKANSYESINSLESINSDLYEELSKVTVGITKPSVKNKAVLPDLINFDAPSTSKFDDYHTMPRSISCNESDAVSLNSNFTYDTNSRRNSSVSAYSKKSALSLSKVECKTRTEDSYVFEAGYMLNMAARCEDMGDYQRAFEYYKSGIEKMLIGVQADTDSQRRAIIKEKTNKYLTYAESIYKNHLYDADQSLLVDREDSVSRALHCPIPISMLRRPYEELSLYRVLAVLGSSLMLVLHRTEQTCYAMKVIQKIPHNLTEFDEYFLQRTNETRQPVLPTNVPYMVPLHAYIETNNLIFLILSYAPGERLFEYIRNHAKSVPTTPAREVNLDNVFAEPLKIRTTSVNITEATKAVNDFDNDNLDKFDTNIEDKGASIVDNTNELEKVNNNFSENIEMKTDDLENLDLSVTELVVNSQKLLQNVDKALKDVPKLDSKEDVSRGNVKVEVVDKEISKGVCDNEEKIHENISSKNKPRPCERRALPPSAVRTWAAQLLTALESLHNAGVVCRDLNPRNILLGDGGQIILTYMLSYPGLRVLPGSRGRCGRARPRVDMCVAPEVLAATFPQPDRDAALDRACDWWSFGAVLYELLCGVPLSCHHREPFTTHTLLHVPADSALTLDAESLLTQLLTYEPAERLGAGKDGIEEIKRHPYFKQVDWREVYDTWTAPD